MLTTKHKSSNEMFPLIEQYLESGLTQKQFCNTQGIKISVFQYWLKKYRVNSNPIPVSNDFMSFEMASNSIAPSSNGKTVIVRFANGNELHLPWT